MHTILVRLYGITSLKTKGRQFDNFAVTGDTVSCRNDNLRYRQWRQICQIDDLLFSMVNKTFNKNMYCYGWPYTPFWACFFCHFEKKVISQWPRIYLVHYHTEISMLKWKVVIAPGLALAWHRSHTSNTWLATLLSGSPHVPIEVSHDSHAVSPGTMGCMSPHWEQVGKAADTFVAAEVTTGSNQDYKHWTFGQPNYFRW